MIAAGAFHATRTTGTVSVCEIACSNGPTSFISAVPCCRSTHRASKPWRAMTSAVNPWDTESQPRVAHCPVCHICLILFGRMVAPLALFVGPGNGLLAIKRKRAPEARGAPTQVGLVSRRDIDFLQKPPTGLDASDIRRDLSHDLSNSRPPCHVGHHGNLGVQPKRACWRQRLRPQRVQRGI